MGKLVCPICQMAYEEERNFCGRCGSDMRRAPPAETRPDAWLGRIVEGRYRVLEKIGQGGMGAVYRVEHLAMGKIAAMKVLHGELSSDREALKRFRREAEAVSRLAHPNTVQVFDFGRADSSLYLVMEYVRGEDLGEILRRDGHLDFARAAPIVVQVCGSVGEAHDLGVIHRDLKPENILVSRTKEGGDFVKVLDFGLAKIREREELASVTARGSLVGTPYYMSPEQIRSEGEPDARSDVYSLGAVLYRALAGEPPFQAQTPVGVLTKHLTVDPMPMRTHQANVPGVVEALVLRALQKRPEDRFQSIDEMRRAVEQAQASLFGSGPSHAAPAAFVAARRASDAALPDDPVDVGSLPTTRMATLPEMDPAESVERLSREDFDRYERRLRRHKTVRLVFVPLALAALAAAAIVGGARLRRPARADFEQEPNNDPAHANPIASDQPARGKIAQRLSREEGDVDVWRIPADGNTPQLLHVAVTGLPNIDLVLEVYDADGQLLAKGDTRGAGEGELLANVRLGAGEHYVVVRQARQLGRVPIEDVSDEYVLTARWHPLQSGEEAEPNDAPAQAMGLAPGGGIVGYLDHRGDVDSFRIEAPAGQKRHARLRLPAGLPARLRRGEREERLPTGGAPFEFEVAGGEIVRLERADAPTDRDEKPPLPGADEKYSLELLPH